MNSVLTRQSPNTPALDCVVQPDSLEQLHLSHLLVSRRAVRLATPGSLSGVLVYAEGGAISEDQNASKWGQFRRSNLTGEPVTFAISRLLSQVMLRRLCTPMLSG